MLLCYFKRKFTYILFDSIFMQLSQTLHTSSLCTLKLTLLYNVTFSYLTKYYIFMQSKYNFAL